MSHQKKERGGWVPKKIGERNHSKNEGNCHPRRTLVVSWGGESRRDFFFFWKKKKNLDVKGKRSRSNRRANENEKKRSRFPTRSKKGGE